MVKALNSRYGFHALCSGCSKSDKDVLQGVQGTTVFFCAVKVKRVKKYIEDEHIIYYILPVMLRTHE